MPSGVYERKPMKKAVREKISRTLKARKVASRTGRPVYPWNRWFAKNRRRFTAWRSDDYTCSSAMMVRSIRNEASKRGVSVSVKTHTAHSLFPECVEVTINR